MTKVGLLKSIIFNSWISAWLIQSNPLGAVIKNPPANARDMGSIPGSGRSPGEGNGNPLQYSCLRNRMDRGVWWATVHGVAKDLDTIEWLNNNKTTALNNIEELPWWSSG